MFYETHVSPRESFMLLNILIKRTLVLIKKQTILLRMIKLLTKTDH